MSIYGNLSTFKLLFHFFFNYTPANIRLDEDVLKTSFVFIFRRRLQDVLIKANMFTLALCLQKTSSRRLQETSWSRPIYSSWLYVFKTSSRHLQDVFKTSSRHLQDIFKTYYQVKLFLLTRL